MSTDMMADFGNPDSMPVLLRMLFQQNIELRDAQQSMLSKLEDVRESVIRLEAAEFKTHINNLEERMKVLEKHEEKRQGVVGVVGWVSSNAPWLVAVAAGAMAYLGWNRHP